MDQEEETKEISPEGWKGDEPEEVRRARTTGGTHHLASQEEKDETHLEEEDGAKCDCQECAIGNEVLEDGEQYMEDEM